MDRKAPEEGEEDIQDDIDDSPFVNGQDPLGDPEERRVIYAVLDSFYQYRKNLHYNTTHRRRQNFYALPSSQWQILASPPFNMLDTFNAVDDAIDHNADLADAILNLGLESFGLPSSPEKGTPQYWHHTAKANDMSKAHSTIRQFYRDWSAEGFSREVKPILDIVLEDLRRSDIHIPSSTDRPTLLLPGAGLGRLLFALAHQGFNVEGNEISYHQLLASNFILNYTSRANQFALFPFATTFTNTVSRTHQLAKTTVPDVHPATALAAAPNPGEMSMTASDFTLCYSRPAYADAFDAVVSVFFIDTAPNVLRYIDTVRNCLKGGGRGVWINIGPLLWHFDDRVSGRQANTDKERRQRGDDEGIGEPGAVELSDQELILLLEKMGFEVTVHEVAGEARDGMGMGYMQDPNSMLQNLYRYSHWVARKL